MNREILFRGKCARTGLWRFGYLSNKDVLNTDNGRIKIIPATVGQFTGLTDKNGVKIFEGDKINIVGGSVTYIVEYKFASFWITRGGGRYSTILDAHDCRFEVIGNIHDNTELIK